MNDPKFRTTTLPSDIIEQLVYSHGEPAVITPALLLFARVLTAIRPYDTQHLPFSFGEVERMRRRLKKLRPAPAVARVLMALAAWGMEKPVYEACADPLATRPSRAAS